MATERFVDYGLDDSVDSDADLFGVIYPSLRRFASAVGPAEVEPDDLVQDAIERTLRRQRLGDLDNPVAYLSRVILNLSSDHRRRLGRARRAAVRLRPEVGIEQAYPSDLADLLRLPPRQRAILYLGQLVGLTNAEIAEYLGMSEQAVAKASQRARRQLRTDLKEEL